MSADAGGRVGQLRRRNTGLVLRVLRQTGASTRTALADSTGLAKATVGSIIAELEKAGLVAETGAKTTGIGRPGRAVGLTGTDVLGLGLEVNVDYVSCVTLDVSGQAHHAEIVPVGDRDPLDVLADHAAERAESAHRSGQRLVGATVAVPGLVDADQATVRWAPNLGWSHLDVASVVRRATGIESCTVDNDANCAALAEVNHGTAPDGGHVVYLTGTVGIGAGFVVDGELQRGADGFAGEVGHLPLGQPDNVCACGRLGCWEATIGLRAMLREIGMADATGDPRELVLEIAARAPSDPDVSRGLAKIGSWLGRGLAAISGITDPDVIVLGGYFVALAPWILPAAEESLSIHLSFADLARPEIRVSTLALEAAAVGAADAALSDVLASGEL